MAKALPFLEGLQLKVKLKVSKLKRDCLFGPIKSGLCRLFPIVRRSLSIVTAIGDNSRLHEISPDSFASWLKSPWKEKTCVNSEVSEIASHRVRVYRVSSDAALSQWYYNMPIHA